MLDINGLLEATQIVNYLMKWIEELRFWPYKPDVSDCDTPVEKVLNEVGLEVESLKGESTTFFEFGYESLEVF